MKRVILIPLILLALLFLSFTGVPWLAEFLTDWYWFRQLGFESVFTGRLFARLGLGFGVGIVAFLFLYTNLKMAQRGIVPDPIVLKLADAAQGADVSRMLQRLSIPIALVLALPMGLAAAGGWLILVSWLNRTPFEVVDPVFGRDVSYYVFTLPLISTFLSLLLGLALLSLLLVVPLYVIRRDIVMLGKQLRIEPSAQWHVAILVAIVFATLGAHRWFVDLPALLHSDRGPMYGASYTDLAVTAPVLRVGAFVMLLGAGLVIWGAQQRRLARSTVISVGLALAVSVMGSLAAVAVQRFQVDPNELSREAPQLEHHIAATRKAWGLEQVVERDLSGESPLTLAHIRANEGTLRNVRLWDRDLLLQTFGQLQAIRTYYDFVSVTDDRYWINGAYRQVMLSGRELNSQMLPARSFINERLVFTHGMGATLTPVNEVAEQGLPVLFIRDLPPRSDINVQITRPEIYYGEVSSDWVIAASRQREFNHPAADENVYTTYEGTGGVAVQSLFRKALFSIRFRSMKVLLSDDVLPGSRVLFHRNIRARVRTALPFLRWDGDPYLIVTDDGRLMWILDAYTTTSRYPYSQSIAGGINYMRNSVKVVIDAYHGTVTPYVADPSDPIVQTWQKAFDGIFRPLDEMPADLRAHIRYPEDLFRIQTSLYAIYHMQEADVLYHREDQWQIPRAVTGAGATRDPFLRHTVMRLPGEEREEFIMMTPFTPRQRDNLRAWMVARMDGDHYGELVVYRFPRQSLVFGPRQIMNRINQDTEIAQQLTLWDQRGSQVIRGNLLVIPIEESLIYVQPIYLRAEGGRIPELRRVVVAYENRVVMEETFERAMARLFGDATELERRAPPARVAADPVDGPPPASARVAELIRSAGQEYERATSAQRSGDWTTYGEAMRRVGELLRELRQLSDGGR